MEGKRRRILLTGIAALMMAAIAVWVLIVVWRSLYRTDLATYGGFAVALVALAVPGIAWAWRARAEQQRGGALTQIEVVQAVTGRDKIAGHAFISYVREDSRQVDKLQRALQSAGVPVWRDTADLWPGEDWRAKIRSAITDNALVFIACVSNASLTRDKSYQNEELALAIEQLRLRRPDDPWLIPVRLDECKIPDWDIGGGRTLASIQRADVFGDRPSEGTARLVAAVKRILGSRTATPPIAIKADPAHQEWGSGPANPRQAAARKYSPRTDYGTLSHAGIEAEIREPSITGCLLRINVHGKFGSRDDNGKYYAEAFGIEGQFPARLLPGPWRVPWNDAPAGRPRYIPWTGADLRLAEWPDDRKYGKKPGGVGRARIAFLEAGDPVKKRKPWGTGPWRVVVRLRREGSDAYMDTAFDIRLESGQIVFQKA